MLSLMPVKLREFLKDSKAKEEVEENKHQRCQSERIKPFRVFTRGVDIDLGFFKLVDFAVNRL